MYRLIATGSSVLKLVLALSSILLSAHAADKKFLPTGVPINLHPPAANETRSGFGYNLMTVKVDWKDDFFTFDNEDIGKIAYTAHNLVFGSVTNVKGESAIEKSWLLGLLTSEADNNFYQSGALGEQVNEDQDSTGFDVGLRYVTSRTLRQYGRDGGTRWDLNFVYSFHVAAFYSEATVTALSASGSSGNTYDEEEFGLFIRPVVAIQPIVYLNNAWTLFPYAAIGTKASLSYYYWEDTEVITLGVSQPFQLSDDDGVEFNYPGLDFQLGFDIGYRTSAGGELTFGAAISQLFNDDEGADFSEFHVMYIKPF